MTKIAIDIDSTLYDFDTPAREACFRLWKETGDEDFKKAAYHTSGEWRSYPDILGLDKWLDVIDLVHSPEAIANMEPFSGVTDVVQELFDAGHQILYISNRSADTLNDTYGWLDDWGLLGGPNDKAELVVTSGSKAPYLASYQYLIDDRVKTVVEFVYDYDWTNRIGSNASDNRKRHAFVKGYSYNINLTDVPGCSVAPSWDGIRHYLEKEGLLTGERSEVLV